MALLAINTASSKTSIALLERGALLSEKNWRSDRDEAEKLLPEIDKMLTEQGKSFKNINEVLVIKGPGSFTGLRVGVTVANTIANLNKCKLYAVDTFEYLWKALGETATDTALLIFAGRGGIYVHMSPDQPRDEIGIINIDKLKEYLNSKGIKRIFGEISSEQKEQVEDFEFVEKTESFGKTIAGILQEEQKSYTSVTPLYIKKPQITQSKKTFF